MEDKFKERVKYFQELFGLGNWNISVFFKGKDFEHNAQTKADPRYYESTIIIQEITLEFEKKWDLIIVHEMIHIVMSLLDFYTDNMTKEGMNELLSVARENSVSQLANIMIRLINKK
jgi:hypothetical protein